MNPTNLSDDELLAELDKLAEEERERMPYFLACLAEAERRRLPEKGGYSSTFDYCVRRLGLSEGETYRRIHASRAANERPELLASLNSGALTLTAVSMIAPHVRRPDAPEIISRAEGRTTRELEALLAPLSAVPPKREVVRARGETFVDFSFRGPAELRAHLDAIRDILSHSMPAAGIADVLLVVVREFLERRRPSGSAKVPAAVRRSVWARDGGRCVYVGADGTRCKTRKFLELDHVRPKALGGEDVVDNLRLLCRNHNDAERRRVLGEGG